MPASRRLIGLLALAILILAGPTVGLGQSYRLQHAAGLGLTGAVTSESATAPRILERDASEPQAASEDDGGHSKFRRRQAILLSGLAVSMIAYGYFALEFNDRRTDSEDARLAYEADVRENAQFYVDEEIPLDEIPAYDAWVDAYNEAYSARELLSIAGLSAFLLGMAAILDSATAGNGPSDGAQAKAVAPLIGVSPASGDVVLGARIGL